MSYVGEPFARDLFVSYSHGSDAMGNPTLRGWSLAFARELERELRADPSFRDTLSVFVDERLDRMAPLTDQLDAQAGAAALLMVLLTPDYQASRWCHDERTWWLAAQADLGIDPEGRVALVRAWPVPAAWPGGGAWPAPLGDRTGQPLVGYPFSSGTGRAERPLGWTQWETGFRPEVREALLGLAADLGQKLDLIKAELDRRRVARAEAERLVTGGALTLYLHGRADHRRHWERAAAELQASGYAVVPGELDQGGDPTQQKQLRQERVEILSNCDALVLVGSPDGRAIDADLIVVGKHDRQSARLLCGRLLPCALLDLVGPSVATTVRRQTARLMQTDWLDATGIPSGVVVQQWLGEKARKAVQG